MNNYVVLLNDVTSRHIHYLSTNINASTLSETINTFKTPSVLLFVKPRILDSFIFLTNVHINLWFYFCLQEDIKILFALVDFYIF